MGTIAYTIGAMGNDILLAINTKWASRIKYTAKSKKNIILCFFIYLYSIKYPHIYKKGVKKNENKSNNGVGR